MLSEHALNGRERVEALNISVAGTIRQAMEAINRGAQGVALLIAPETKRFEVVIGLRRCGGNGI